MSEVLRDDRHAGRFQFVRSKKKKKVLLAFLDDIHTVTMTERVRVWKRVCGPQGKRPGCDELEKTAGARANYVALFCWRHHAGWWQCLCTILPISPDVAVGFGRSLVAICCVQRQLDRCSARHPQSSSRGGSPVGDSTGRCTGVGKSSEGCEGCDGGSNFPARPAPGWNNTPCFFLQASSRTGAGIGAKQVLEQRLC